MYRLCITAMAEKGGSIAGPVRILRFSPLRRNGMGRWTRDTTSPPYSERHPNNLMQRRGGSFKISCEAIPNTYCLDVFQTGRETRLSPPVVVAMLADCLPYRAGFGIGSLERRQMTIDRQGKRNVHDFACVGLPHPVDVEHGIRNRGSSCVLFPMAIKQLRFHPGGEAMWCVDLSLDTTTTSLYCTFQNDKKARDECPEMQTDAQTTSPQTRSLTSGDAAETDFSPLPSSKHFVSLPRRCP